MQQLKIVIVLSLMTRCISIGGSFRASSFRERDYFSESYEPYINEDELDVKEKPEVPSTWLTSPVPRFNNMRGSAMPKQTPVQPKSNWVKNFPKVNVNFDPIVNFKVKQRFYQLGTCVTLGMDYLSELGRWRFHLSAEDTIVGGRFSVRGSELGWAKSWRANMGLGEDNTVKFKLRVGYNMKTKQSYARVRFRTEPLTPFDIQEGLVCTGRVPLPGVLPVLRVVPLRVEYKFRMKTPAPSFEMTRQEKDDRLAFSTGIDRIDVSVDELNFCLEWDDSSPLWDIGIVRRASEGRERIADLMRRRNIPTDVFKKRFWAQFLR
mmetsp:Transcript_35599/g.36304  ORF Transcript_35599/g.36304 Transcript_35599/m.36304 type:complete len:320 (+) Transcript_35599:300-1259(+)|eukprot:CAMPEP_0182431580 /NCGR_PEP_ID=MMETSP1167-20130531/50280_1 /TAXON_ID=2988 /ORGANISM="Mallomonas Sp, Strain CCMP3275" /LENGTH=319 /DNA_ID=CAMNT_0024618069 /DNA_START=285 /DNA_END=1244 /DNA_ORIENTATION=+